MQILAQLLPDMHRMRAGILVTCCAGWAFGMFGQEYVDVAPAQGVDHLVVAPPLVDFGCGVSFHDFDGDGWDDLTFGHMNDSLIFYRNVEGNLVRMPSFAPHTGETKQVLWADIDNDGDDDFLVTTFEGNVRLFRNEGDWTFTDITESAGFVEQDGKRYGASFGDYDRDGDLDLYICTYIYDPEPFAFHKVNQLYRNEGDGTFTNVTIQAGVGNGLQASFQSAWIDVDLDGWPDLYVINDFEGANALYRNNGDGTFTDMAEELGLALEGEHPMSISLSDFDLDGDVDIFITNTGIFPMVNNARSMLMVNQGDGTFAESSEDYGLNIFEWGWGAVWVDRENDGYHDLYIPTHRELALPVPNLYYRNVNGESFEEALEEAFPGPQITSGHCAARGDLNGDGYADIVVQNQAPFRPYIWQNTGGSASWVRIGVEGTLSNRNAIGTWIRLYAGGRQYVHYTVSGENYISQNSQHIPFGLGDATVIDSVVVTYLSGHVDRYFDLPVNTHHRFVEGETYPVTIIADGPFVQCAPAIVLLDAGEHAGYLWNTGDTGQILEVDASGTYQVTVLTPLGLEVTSPSVEVVIGAAPVVVADVTGPLCAEDATGSVELVNLSGVDVAEVSWAHGPSGPQLADLGVGVYSYELTDVNGCSASGEVEVLAPEPLFIQVVPTAATDGSNGRLEWTVFGGTPPYSVLVNGEPMSGSALDGLASGMYTVVVTDANACTTGVNVLVSGGVGWNEEPAPSVGLFPNPVVDRLHVVVDRAIRMVVLHDAAGRRVHVRSTVGREGAVLDVQDLPPGLYLLELYMGDDAAWRGRFIKE